MREGWIRGEGTERACSLPAGRVGPKGGWIASPDFSIVPPHQIGGNSMPVRYGFRGCVKRPLVLLDEVVNLEGPNCFFCGVVVTLPESAPAVLASDAKNLVEREPLSPSMLDCPCQRRHHPPRESDAVLVMWRIAAMVARAVRCPLEAARAGRCDPFDCAKHYIVAAAFLEPQVKIADIATDVFGTWRLMMACDLIAGWEVAGLGRRSRIAGRRSSLPIRICCHLSVSVGKGAAERKLRRWRIRRAATPSPVHFRRQWLQRSAPPQGYPCRRRERQNSRVVGASFTHSQQQAPAPIDADHHLDPEEMRVSPDRRTITLRRELRREHLTHRVAGGSLLGSLGHVVQPFMSGSGRRGSSHSPPAALLSWWKSTPGGEPGDRRGSDVCEGRRASRHCTARMQAGWVGAIGTTARRSKSSVASTMNAP